MKKHNTFSKYLKSRTQDELEEITQSYQNCNNDCDNCSISCIEEDEVLLCAVFETVMPEYMMVQLTI